MSKGRSIFVSGGTGFVGSYILRWLVHEGYDQIIALKRPESDLSLVAPVAERINWIEGDLNDTEVLFEVLEQVEGVIHAGALVSLDPRDRSVLYKTNVLGTANLVNAALHGNVRKFIFISSIATFSRLFDQQQFDEMSEWEESKLNSVYATSKYQAELEVWRGGVEGLPVVILNPSVILGSGFWDRSSVAMFKNIYYGIHYYPVGGSGFVDVRDVAKAAVQFLEKEVNGKKIIISGENRSWKDIFSLIAQNLIKKPPSSPLKPWLNRLVVWNSIIQSLWQPQRIRLSLSLLRRLNSTFYYSNTRSKEILDLNYTPIDETIRETCMQLLESVEENQIAKFLPF